MKAKILKGKKSNLNSISYGTPFRIPGHRLQHYICYLASGENLSSQVTDHEELVTVTRRVRSVVVMGDVGEFDHGIKPVPVGSIHQVDADRVVVELEQVSTAVFRDA